MAATAWSSVFPTTFGTGCFGLLPGPLETLICTCEWNGRLVPAGFACWTTVPSGSSDGTKNRLARIPAWPIVCAAAGSSLFVPSGMGAFCGCGGAAAVVVCWDVVVGVVVWLCLDTDSVTADPFASFAPGFGAWSTIVPAGWSEGTWVTVESSPC